MTVTKPPRRVLLPYRDDTKSESEVMRLRLQIRMILRRTSHHNATMTVGPR